MTYAQGLHELASGCHAYLQPSGSWGWNNAGLISDGEATLLVDTLFDTRLTAQMLEAMRDAVPAAKSIGTVVNTHANGDHCWGNELVRDAEIIASRRGAEEMAELPPALMAKLDKIARLSLRGPAISRGVAKLAGKLGVELLESVFEAAKDIDLRDYADLGEAERMVVNVDTLYRDFSGAPARKSVVPCFAAMARYAGKAASSPHAH